MIEIYYINSNLQKFEFNKDAKIKELNLHKYEFEKMNNSTLFSLKETRIPFTLMLFGSTSKIKRNLEKFYEITSIDRTMGVKGKLFYGDYFLEGNFISEQIQPYADGIATNKINFYTENPNWIKTKSFYFQQNKEQAKNTKRYNNRYPYRYDPTASHDQIQNDDYVSSNCLIRIFGPCIAPTVQIGSTKFTVHTTLKEQERLEIDTKNKTVIKVDQMGKRINEFDKREKHVDFFRKIPAGSHSVSYGEFTFEIVLYKERSMPGWN